MKGKWNETMEKHNEKVRVEEAELLEKMASINGFSYKDNLNCLNCFKNVITEELKHDGGVYIEKIGTMYIETISEGEKTVRRPCFKADPGLKQAVNKTTSFDGSIDYDLLDYMKEPEYLEIISTQNGFSISKNKAILQTFCDVVCKELIDKKTIALSGFGAFYLKAIEHLEDGSLS